MTNREAMRRVARPPLVVAASLLAACFLYVEESSAQTVTLSNLEVILAEPDNDDAINYALWAGFYTQVYEYSMPFIEICLDDDDLAVSEFRMTIGDSAFQFEDEFQNIQHTNSTAQSQPGGYARLGQSSSSGVGFTSSVEDGGDTLVIDFGTRGLQPGEKVRLQVDIGSDDPSGEVFPSYTSVFFDANANPADSSDNSLLTLTFVDDSTSMLTLPDFAIDSSTLPSLSMPRSYSDMQMVDPLDPMDFDEVIPEPTAAVLVLAGALGVSIRRRRTG